MWQHFLGYGFTKPIDDLGPHNTPSHPALLDYLGEEVRKNSFNLKELIRWIVLSEPIRSRARSRRRTRPTIRCWAKRPSSRISICGRCRPRSFTNRCCVATQADKSRGSYEEQEKLKADWMKQFVIAFGTDEGDEADDLQRHDPASPDADERRLVKKAIDTKEKGSFLNQIGGKSFEPAAAIHYLYEAALSRHPTTSEIGVANKLLVAEGDGLAAMQDMFWALFEHERIYF